MADTAHKTEEEYVEHFDKPEVFEKKINTLAQWIKESKHFIAFTGAGVSTAAGVPDFRSGMNTVLNTGPGAWTIRAEQQKKGEAVVTKAPVTTSTIKAIPTATHMSLVELQRRGVLKYLISQNTDGLHRRSGMPPEALSELHGNSNIEICMRCGHQYLRDFRVRTAQGVFEHKTGRNCAVPGCKGELKDTIINFKENLPEKPLELGLQNASKADLCLSMGSSLRVSPACDMPDMVAERHRLVIVNLQSTPLDKVAALRINAKCDDVMIAVMKKLDILIPEFRLKRWAKITTSNDRTDLTIAVDGVDVDGIPASVFKAAGLEFGNDVDLNKRQYTLVQEPFQLKVPLKAFEKTGKFKGTTDCVPVTLRLGFYGHYKEPVLAINLGVSLKKNESKTYQLTYNPFTGTWVEAIDIAKLKEQQESKSKEASDSATGGERKSVVGDSKDAKDASPSKSQVKSIDEMVAEFEKMGFKAGEALKALKAVNGSYEKALETLKASVGAQQTASATKKP